MASSNVAVFLLLVVGASAQAYGQTGFFFSGYQQQMMGLGGNQGFGGYGQYGRLCRKSIFSEDLAGFQSCFCDKNHHDIDVCNGNTACEKELSSYYGKIFDENCVERFEKNPNARRCPAKTKSVDIAGPGACWCDGKHKKDADELAEAYDECTSGFFTPGRRLLAEPDADVFLVLSYELESKGTVTVDDITTGVSKVENNAAGLEEGQKICEIGEFSSGGKDPNPVCCVCDENHVNGDNGEIGGTGFSCGLSGDICLPNIASFGIVAIANTPTKGRRLLSSPECQDLEDEFKLFDPNCIERFGSYGAYNSYGYGGYRSMGGAFGGFGNTMQQVYPQQQQLFGQQQFGGSVSYTNPSFGFQQQYQLPQQQQQQQYFNGNRGFLGTPFATQYSSFGR